MFLPPFYAQSRYMFRCSLHKPLQMCAHGIFPAKVQDLSRGTC